MTAEAETGEARPQARDTWARGAGKGRKDTLFEALEGVCPWDTLVSDLWPQNWERMSLCALSHQLVLVLQWLQDPNTGETRWGASLTEKRV